MRIGNENPDNFVAECYVCTATNRLNMKAMRRNTGIVGWIFVCPKCETKVSEVYYKEVRKSPAQSVVEEANRDH